MSVTTVRKKVKRHSVKNGKPADIKVAPSAKHPSFLAKLLGWDPAGPPPVPLPSRPDPDLIRAFGGNVDAAAERRFDLELCRVSSAT